MSNANISNELQKHIDLVIAELRTTSGARVIAAAAGIEEGINYGDEEGWPDSLMAHGEDLIGLEAVYEGYDHDYSLDDDATEFENGRPVLGWGISMTSYEAYLDLHLHFGAQWLERTVMSGASTIGEAKTLLETAQRNFQTACAVRRDARLKEIACEMADLAAEAQRLAA